MAEKNQGLFLVIIVIAVILIIWQCSNRRSRYREGFSVPGYDVCSPSVAVPYACSSLGSCGTCGGQGCVSGEPFKNSQEYGWQALDNTLFNAVYGNTQAHVPQYSSSCGSRCCRLCAAGSDGSSMAAGSCGYGTGYDM